MKLAELIGVLGFEFDDTELVNFEDGIKTATASLAVIGTAIAGAGVATFAFVQDIAAGNDELGKMSERLGISTADLQGWQYAAELGGGSADSMSSSLENLAKVASEAARGTGAGVEVFGMLGLSATDANGRLKDSSVLMEEVADRMSKLSTQGQKLEFASKLGISADTIIALQQGSEALKRQRLEAEQLGFTLDKNATKNAANFNDELLKVTKIVQGVSSSIATSLMPEITLMMTAFKDWFIANKEIIKQNLQGFLNGVIDVFKAMFDIVRRVANVLNVMAQAVGGWKTALIGVGAVITALNAKILLIPLLMGVVALAVFLAIEDIITYFQGGESAIGDFIDQFPILSGVILSLVGGIGALIVGITSLKVATTAMMIVANAAKIGMAAFNLVVSANPLGLLVVAIGAVITGLVLLYKNFDTVKEAILNFKDIALNSMDSFIDKIKSVAGTISEFILKPFREAKNMLSSLTDVELPNPISAVKDFFGNKPDISANILSPQKIASSSNNTSSTSTNDFKVDINVSGASGDPQVIAQTISGEIGKWFNGVNAQTQKDLASPIKG